jgi:hypothetical protein
MAIFSSFLFFHSLHVPPFSTRICIIRRVYNLTTLSQFNYRIVWFNLLVFRQMEKERERESNILTWKVLLAYKKGLILLSLKNEILFWELNLYVTFVIWKNPLSPFTNYLRQYKHLSSCFVQESLLAGWQRKSTNCPFEPNWVCTQ